MCTVTMWNMNQRNEGDKTMNVAQLSESGKEQYKKVICEELWLRYFNDTLRKKNIISEKEHRMMFVKIVERTGSLLKGLDQQNKIKVE